MFCYGTHQPGFKLPSSAVRVWGSTDHWPAHRLVKRTFIRDSVTRWEVQSFVVKHRQRASFHWQATSCQQASRTASTAGQQTSRTASTAGQRASRTGQQATTCQQAQQDSEQNRTAHNRTASTADTWHTLSKPGSKREEATHLTGEAHGTREEARLQCPATLWGNCSAQAMLIRLQAIYSCARQQQS